MNALFTAETKPRISALHGLSTGTWMTEVELSCSGIIFPWNATAMACPPAQRTSSAHQLSAQRRSRNSSASSTTPKSSSASSRRWHVATALRHMRAARRARLPEQERRLLRWGRALGCGYRAPRGCWHMPTWCAHMLTQHISQQDHPSLLNVVLEATA